MTALSDAHPNNVSCVTRVLFATSATDVDDSEPPRPYSLGLGTLSSLQLSRAQRVTSSLSGRNSAPIRSAITLLSDCAL